MTGVQWCDLGAVETWEDIGDAEPPTVGHLSFETYHTAGLELWTPELPDGWIYSDATVTLVDQADPIDR